MSDTSTNWKRGLLKAWLALSLLWGAGVGLYALITTDWFVAVTVRLVSPLGLGSPLAILIVGSISMALFERLRTRR